MACFPRGAAFLMPTVMTRGPPFSPWRSITGEGPLAVERARREGCGCEEHGRRTENRRAQHGRLARRCQCGNRNPEGDELDVEGEQTRA